jgi:hypothetical protein
MDRFSKRRKTKKNHYCFVNVDTFQLHIHTAAVLSALSSYNPEFLHVIQTGNLSREFLVLGTERSHMGPNQESMVNFPTLVLVSGQRLVLFNKCTAT